MSILDRQAPLRLALDETESAKCIGVSTSTFRQLVRDGLIRRCKIYRCTRYLVTDLQAFLESQRENEQEAAGDEFQAATQREASK